MATVIEERLRYLDSLHLGSGSWAAVAPTVRTLQTSAFLLLDRMIEAH